MNNSIIPLIVLSLFTLALSTGCPAEDNNANNENNTNNGEVDETADVVVDKDETIDEPDVTVDEEKDETVTTSGWAKVSVGCIAGNNNVALHFDGQRGYMGCGDAGEGTGLFLSEDGGRTWGASARAFNQARILDVRRGPDGKLYGAGRDTLDKARVFEIDDSTPANPKLVSVFVPQSNTAGVLIDRARNIAITEDGQMYTHAIVGAAAAYKPAGSDEWQELAYISEEALGNGDTSGALLISEIRTFDNKFYAVGSRNSDEAEIKLPSKLPGATYHFQTIKPVKNRDIELWDLHVWSESKMIAVGDNASDRNPVILLGEGDVYDEANWTKIDLFDSGIEIQGDIHGMAVQGDTVVVVGGQFPSSKGGFALKSEDAGKTWTDITPVPDTGKVSLLWKVHLWENGDIYAAGDSAGWSFKK